MAAVVKGRNVGRSVAYAAQPPPVLVMPAADLQRTLDGLRRDAAMRVARGGTYDLAGVIDTGRPPYRGSGQAADGTSVVVAPAPPSPPVRVPDFLDKATAAVVAQRRWALPAAVGVAVAVALGIGYEYAKNNGAKARGTGGGA